MRPRQPDVPNLMGEVAMWRYSRPRELESRKFGDGPGRGNCGKCARRASNEERRAGSNCTGDLGKAGGRSADRAQCRFQAPGGVRQYYLEPGRVVLYMERESREGQGIRAGE